MLPGDLSVERWQQIDALFAEALERPLPERERFLQDATRDDPELRREVQELLESTPPAEAMLGESVSQYAEPVLSSLREELRDREGDGLPPGGRIGPYRIQSELGRGGMGAVYLAERADDAFEKQVALKLVKRGMDTDEVLRRFRYERQILASLEHPNIARLYDGGAADDGRPYLVMEYIQGQPITAHCDERRRTIAERLRLFETVCEAVQFAHRNLVIHRDIKPSNILVDVDGTVKLLDFGIAKLLGPPEIESDFQTRAEQRLITPEYASPEQLAGRPVTTASDVYALGVVLYELLTGRRPRDRRFGGATTAQATDPAIERPSSVIERPIPTRPGGLQPPTPDQIPAARGTTTQRLRRHIHGDLDTIAMKALAEEPERRYQSAEQLLGDVQRYLSGRPVLARGESPVYRTRKFVRRHRVGVGFSAALALLALTFTATTLLQAREVAERRAIAESRQGQAEHLIGFILGDLRGKLTPIDRLDVLQDVGTQVLEYFTAVPPEELSEQELFNRSEALRLLGQVEFERGNWEEAAHTHGEALILAEDLVSRDSLNGEWQLGLAMSHFRLGELRYHRADAQGALEHWRDYQRIAERLVRQERDNPTYRLELSYALTNVAAALEFLREYGHALDVYLEELEQRQSLADLDGENLEFQSALATTYGRIASVQTALGNLGAALDEQREEVRVRQGVVDRATNDVDALSLLGRAHGYLGELAIATGEDDEGLEHRLTAWNIAQELVDRDRENVLWQLDLATTARLAGAGLVRSGQPTAALEALESSRQLAFELVEKDPQNDEFRQELSWTEAELAAAYRLSDRPDLAADEARRALATIEPVRTAQPDHLPSRRVESEAALELGRAYALLGRAAEARAAWERAVAAIRPAVEASASVGNLSRFAFALLLLDELDEARAIGERLVQRGYRRSDFLALAREKGVHLSDSP